MLSFKSIRSINNYWIFGISLLSGMLVILCMAFYSKLHQAPTVDVRHLHGNLWVTEQIKLEAIPDLKNQGFNAIIDLRPDGEAKDQASSAEVAAAANRNQLGFSYVPVLHGEIPDTAVNSLELALANTTGNVLLYCRSGKRAARTWSLLEASRSGGLNAREILAAVKSSGQSADDLEATINARIENRHKLAGSSQ